MKYLFIGGPSDGEWLNAPDGRAVVSVSAPMSCHLIPHDADIAFSKHTYRMEVFRDSDGEDHFVYVYSSVKNVMETLINGYGKKALTD